MENLLLSVLTNMPISLYIDPGSAAITVLVLGIIGGLISIASFALALIISARMAQKRGRNVVAWVVISIFIGWIAVIILAAIGNAENQSSDNQQ